MKGLVLDGGGVFGIGQAEILSRIDVSKFDFFVGTSIGGCIAAALANKTILPSDLPVFFETYMPQIFGGNWWRSRKFFTPKYNDKQLNAAIKDLVGGTLLGSCDKPLFITAANLKNRSLKVFSSLDPDDASWPIWEVVRMTVAAQTYFAPWKGYGDGGVFANNPSMVAIAAACNTLKCKLEDIELCSIGTGISTKPQEIHNMWSLVHWGSWLIQALLDGASSSMHNYFVSSLPIKKYLRIEFIREDSWKMDSPKDMLKAREAWYNDIQRAVKDIDNF